ncbi:MAG: hypothetical protein ACYTKD_05055 [Planctomycetota bacterium]|jgi:hypothetical protein
MQKTKQQRYWQKVVHLLVDYTQRRFPVFGSKISGEIHARKNALLYRWGAVWWHVELAERLISSVLSQAEPAREQGNLHWLLRSNLDRSSYLFDDAVFNLLSMFDYLAGLVGLVMADKLGKSLKWNALMDTLHANPGVHPEAARVAVDAHKAWVNRLAGYRAGVYHSKTDLGSAEFQDWPPDDQIQVRFFVPDGALRKIPAFQGKEKVELVAGLRQIVEQSEQVQWNVLAAFIDEKGTGRDQQTMTDPA